MRFLSYQALLSAVGFILGAAVCYSAEPTVAGATASTAGQPGRMRRLFDGVTLEGWIQEPVNATNFSGGDIVDLAALVKRLNDKSDAVSIFIVEQLDDAAKAALDAGAAGDAAATKAAKSALSKSLSKIVAGPSIYDAQRFAGVTLRDETQKLREKKPEGRELARLNRVLLEDAYPNVLATTPAVAWIVKDGAMASTGAGRGVIYTKDDFSKYRLMFSLRQVSGNHAPCFLIFCTRPVEGEKALDALGGIQFQPPKGGHWDYRPGQNKGGVGFTSVTKPAFDSKQWSRVEILVDATAGTAKMAVAQPVGSKAVEVLDYAVPEAGKTGPIAWQMHNGGIFDEYKDVEIEVDPVENELVSIK